MKIINIRENFSRYPAGRYRADGPYNGEKFREELLVPALSEAIDKGEKVKVELDGVRGYNSSFLEEAFGGLVRSGKFASTRDLSERFEFVSTDKSLIEEIRGYMEEATPAVAQ
ncbi:MULTISPECIES: STAS-like domain-containing protein [Nitrosomonas]|jgi:hypothetical protein|uniref:DUF4325 domain-containing protein n=1 Tax=Nitrosomonas europaea (strain ATCC 19718 / CIP 103999 / KCTC 2705 / NBRC 14298) TaxID=228410 RepID=Q82UU3_NITEU|nr:MULTISPECIES: STAS-like domain-containing protein [Nitrosomonas]KXK50017.1 MAG: hypothetical protein UZ02_AOB001000167 [Nitrosomonas europaea]MBV6388684.1 hypothetical protein [Nitrosomonas europaea]CAD85291.1 hypothetical protein NE1380 [Nitrosomonas europaea ATCC 19718]SDW09143.1 protein of unknown function [Nitrosomonas europaea]SES72318.1 protein of unknown function [Nitrosomonas europaea]